MTPNDIVLTIVFCSQTVTGVLGNSFLIWLFSILFLKGHRLRIIDLIHIQLAWANSLVLLSKGIPQTVRALGLKNLDGDDCTIVLYLHRVARALSLTMTCLLSGFQAITICPSTPKRAELKARARKYIIPFSLFCWIFYMVLNIIVLQKIKGARLSRNISNIPDIGYCSLLDTIASVTLFTVVIVFPDVVWMGLMVLVSGYMVMFLHRHHKRIQVIRMTSLSHNASPEIRATQSILLLLSTFVCFYALNSILVIYIHFRKPRFWLVQCSSFLAACFPNISPFVLIYSDSQILKYCYTL